MCSLSESVHTWATWPTGGRICLDEIIESAQTLTSFSYFTCNNWDSSIQCSLSCSSLVTLSWVAEICKNQEKKNLALYLYLWTFLFPQQNITEFWQMHRYDKLLVLLYFPMSHINPHYLRQMEKNQTRFFFFKFWNKRKIYCNYSLTAI